MAWRRWERSRIHRLGPRRLPAYLPRLCCLATRSNEHMFLRRKGLVHCWQAVMLLYLWLTRPSLAFSSPTLRGYLAPSPAALPHHCAPITSQRASCSSSDRNTLTRLMTQRYGSDARVPGGDAPRERCWHPAHGGGCHGRRHARVRGACCAHPALAASPAGGACV